MDKNEGQPARASNMELSKIAGELDSNVCVEGEVHLERIIKALIPYLDRREVRNEYNGLLRQKRKAKNPVWHLSRGE